MSSDCLVGLPDNCESLCFMGIVQTIPFRTEFRRRLIGLQKKGEEYGIM